MSATKLANANIGESYADEIISKNLLKVGHHNIAFENWDNDSELTMIASSSLEVGGNIHVWDEAESISGDISGYTGIVYVRTDTDGEGNLSLVYDTTSLLPSWSKIQKGYYDSSGNKFIASFNRISISDVYTNKKWLLSESEVSYDLKVNALIHGDYILYPLGAIFFNGYFYFAAKDNYEYNISILRTTDGKEFEEVFSVYDATGNLNLCNIGQANGVIYFAYRLSTTWSHFISYDGLTYSAISTTVSLSSSVTVGRAFGETLFCYKDGVYIICGDTTIAYSTDLSTWTTVTVGGGYNSLYVFKDYFVVVAVTGYRAYYSTDGTSWTAMTYPNNSSKIKVAISDTTMILIAGTAVYRTTDCVNFETLESLPTTGGEYMVASNNNKVFAGIMGDNEYLATQMEDAFTAASPTWVTKFNGYGNYFYYTFSDGLNYGCMVNLSTTGKYELLINNPKNGVDNWRTISGYTEYTFLHVVGDNMIIHYYYNSHKIHVTRIS